MSVTFPGETAAYRSARDELLKAEMDLMRHTEKVATLRRALPLGGKVASDYVFDEAGNDVKLSALFGDKSTLVLYSFMFGPKAEAPCPMCTSFLDALNGNADAIAQNVALSVTAKSPFARIQAFARGRHWDHLRLISSASSTYQFDYHGEDKSSNQWPMMNVFTKKDAAIYHFWGSEMLYAKGEEGMDSRHIDTLWPLWNILDLTPQGRGAEWYPSNVYAKR